MSDASRAPGSLVDTFRIEAARARWGLGECYDATDTTTDRRVVLKLLPGAVARGRAEARWWSASRPSGGSRRPR